MFAESDFLPLSALQHVVFCERQAALIHVEQVWLDNVWTVEGSQLHETVISGVRESRGQVRITRDLPLRSLRLGLIGRADVVEFHRGENGCVLPGSKSLWRPFPVEYKRGRPKRHRADEIQLCAQALCLEEALQVEIPEGALFYGSTRHRTEVVFDQMLRDATEAAANRFREIFDRRRTPEALYEPKKCDSCSLTEICRPKSVKKSVTRYLAMLRAELVTPQGEA